MSRFAVVLPAAGKSSRFGGKEKKPFASLGGRAVWLRAAELFWTRDDVSRVYVVVSPDDRELFEVRFRAALVFANGTVVDGGSERFESVANALAVIPDDVEFVAVHDAVRPLCPKGHIDAVFAAAVQHGAAMLAVPVADTLKRVDDANRIVETVPRAGLWAAQTPQVFRRDWLAEAYAKRGELTVPITDDAQLMEAVGRTAS
jgi:2-C-methyl-D-erythritol 4-phosphate cytidylyltransferase